MSVYVYLSLYLIFTDIGKLKKHEHLFYIFTTTEKKDLRHRTKLPTIVNHSTHNVTRFTIISY